MDSLKGSLSSLEAGKAVAEGIRRIYPGVEVLVRPLADGGEGTVQALALGMQGRIEKITVTGPLGVPVECEYGIIDGCSIDETGRSTGSPVDNGPVSSSEDDGDNSNVGDVGTSRPAAVVDSSSSSAHTDNSNTHNAGHTAGASDITRVPEEERKPFSTGSPVDSGTVSSSGDDGDNRNAGDVGISRPAAVVDSSSSGTHADNSNIHNSGHTAVIEMAGAAGITLVPEEQRNPLNTSTYGVGEVIRDAILKGCRNFIIGIGGSATNDGGTGMLQALGYEFLDKNGLPITYGAKGLEQLCEIRSEHVLPELAECRFRVACDVTNPLCGEKGCSAVFGPQKGATSSMIQEMDAWLKDYAALAAESFPKADPDQPGCGAAGGLGFAFLTFTNASLESGIHMILEETRLEDYIKECDFVITGEGRLDAQTVMGKAPIGVAALAKKHGKKVLAFSGSVTEDAGACNQHGIDAFFPILRSIVTLKEAMEPERTAANLTDTAEQVFRLIRSLDRTNSF